MLDHNRLGLPRRGYSIRHIRIMSCSVRHKSTIDRIKATATETASAYHSRPLNPGGIVSSN